LMEEVEVKVRQIEAIDLADGGILVQREMGRYGNKIAIEVRDGEHYLRENVFDEREVVNLFYFLKPIVERELEERLLRYEETISQNEEELKKAREKGRESVWGFWDPSIKEGWVDIQEAEAKLEEQKRELSRIRKQLEVLRLLKVSTEYTGE